MNLHKCKKGLKLHRNWALCEIEQKWTGSSQARKKQRTLANSIYGIVAVYRKITDNTSMDGFIFSVVEFLVIRAVLNRRLSLHSTPLYSQWRVYQEKKVCRLKGAFANKTAEQKKVCRYCNAKKKHLNKKSELLRYERA